MPTTLSSQRSNDTYRMDLCLFEPGSESGLSEISPGDFCVLLGSGGRCDVGFALVQMRLGENVVGRDNTEAETFIGIHLLLFFP